MSPPPRRRRRPSTSPSTSCAGGTRSAVASFPSGGLASWPMGRTSPPGNTSELRRQLVLPDGDRSANAPPLAQLAPRSARALCRPGAVGGLARLEPERRRAHHRRGLYAVSPAGSWGGALGATGRGETGGGPSSQLYYCICRRVRSDSTHPLAPWRRAQETRAAASAAWPDAGSRQSLPKMASCACGRGRRIAHHNYNTIICPWRPIPGAVEIGGPTWHLLSHVIPGQPFTLLPSPAPTT